MTDDKQENERKRTATLQFREPKITAGAMAALGGKLIGATPDPQTGLLVFEVGDLAEDDARGFLQAVAEHRVSVDLSTYIKALNAVLRLIDVSRSRSRR